MRIALLGAGLLLGTFLLSPLGTVDASHVCDPYPIGRCGAYQREVVTFCYLKLAGLYVNVTDPGVVSIGGASGIAIATGEDGALYLRQDPVEAFVADPGDAPLPSKFVLYQESNNVGGLQHNARPGWSGIPNFKCSNWVWYAECEPAQWMGPVLNVTKAWDDRLL